MVYLNVPPLPRYSTGTRTLAYLRVSLSIRATLGAACLDAIQQACPQIDPDGLVVDIVVRRDDGTEPTQPEIWIC